MPAAAGMVEAPGPGLAVALPSPPVTLAGNTVFSDKDGAERHCSVWVHVQFHGWGSWPRRGTLESCPGLGDPHAEFARPVKKAGREEILPFHIWLMLLMGVMGSESDSVFLLLSPENEFRGELLNQRWTCGEKISSCEGAASLHGTRIKVSRKPSGLHVRVLSVYGDLPPQALATG